MTHELPVVFAGMWTHGWCGVTHVLLVVFAGMWTHGGRGVCRDVCRGVDARVVWCDARVARGVCRSVPTAYPANTLREDPLRLANPHGDIKTLQLAKTLVDTTTTQVILAPSADQIGRP